MGWNNPGEIQVTTLIVSGTNEGIFIYNGTPANGNLIMSFTSAAGTDPYGNRYNAGQTILTNSPLISWTDPTYPAANDGATIQGFTHALELDGPVNTVTNKGAFINIADTGIMQLSAFQPGSQFNAFLTSLGIEIGSGPSGMYYAEQFPCSGPRNSGVSNSFLTFGNWSQTPTWSYTDYAAAMSNLGLWTCPETGLYDLSIDLVFARPTTAVALAMKIRDTTASVDVTQRELTTPTLGVTPQHFSLSDIVNLTKGHVYDVQTTTSSSTATSWTTASSLAIARRI